MPSQEIRKLRTISRQRETLIRYRAAHIEHMQKALHLMNLQLDNVISDLTGKTGMKIIRAIIAGERDPKFLSRYRDPKCKNRCRRRKRSIPIPKVRRPMICGLIFTVSMALT